MSNPVQVYGPDGTLRDTVNFSTTREYRVFRGTCPQETFELQVSINGSGFSSDDSLSLWGDGEWVVPNPSSDPDGLFLLPGENTVKVRSVLTNGTTTPTATATVKLANTQDLGVQSESPTNISVVQKNATVVISAESSGPTGFQGMNFWASLFEGGGVSGYTRININRVSEGAITQETSEFGDFSVDAEVVVDTEGDPVADPMFFRVQANQEDSDEKSLQVDYNKRWEVPETTRTIRMSGKLQSVRNVVLYQFEHSRSGSPGSTPATVSVGSFSAASPEKPLYYVVTAVYYDPDQNLEYESSFSEEVVAKPTLVTTALTSIPSVSRKTITEQFISAVFRSNPQIKVEAGSLLRDTVINPFSSESERLRFVLDFFNRARSPTLLLQVDDPKNTGSSILVTNSAYKQALQRALYLENADSVQAVIDSGFDSYASNFGIRRREGTSAQGEVFFYTRSRPNQTLIFPIGTTVSGGSQNYATTRAVSISLENIASFFDPTSGRYGVNAPVRSSSVGSQGNLSLGQVQTLNSTISTSVKISVINRSAMVGGGDRESNLALTNRVRNALASVDSGTKRGYLQTAADVAGVNQANVVAAGEPLMQRDLNEEGEHKGGKVDIWVQGENIATVTDTFAFAFDIGQDIQFEVLGNPSEYKFRALDPSLTPDKPIVEMLDDESLGYGLRNASTGEYFDLTGVTVTTYSTIQLSTAVPQPAISLSDVILGSYRRRSGNVFILPRQPVQTVTSVVGAVSGGIQSANVTLVRPNSPLTTGKSKLAGDYVQIEAYTNSEGALVPSSETVSVLQEEHVLVGQYPEFLDNLGTNFLTVEVFDATGTIQYKGPNDPSGNPDYAITLGTQTEALSITRVESGSIPSGATVLVDYSHDENFTVTYTTNIIVSTTQEAVDERKHATADVLVKEAIGIPVDLEATVILIRGRDRSTVDTSIRTNLSNFFENLRLGDPVRQSDVINVIEETVGVSYVVVPLSKMVPQDDSGVVREGVSTDTVSESVLLTAYTTNKAVVYILTEELDYATADSGGDGAEFQGVFQNDFALDLLNAGSPLDSLGVEEGRAYILGNSGRSIPGFSDDTTLEEQGYVTPEAKSEQRARLTANRVLVSLPVGSSPTGFAYSVTYTVNGDSGAKNIDPNAASFCSLGPVTLTLDEDR